LKWLVNFLNYFFSLFGFQSEDATSFIIMLVPFILSWTIGYLGFSSFFAFLVAGGVYWTMFTKHRYIRKHTWLTELVGNCITGENTCIEEKEELYRQCKLANIPMRQIPASLMHNDQQRAEWLNIIISQMWPFISDYIKRILREVY
jgi:Ca2+-dependent lipid-binding protein